MTFIDNNKAVFIGAGVLLGLLAASWLASVLLYALLGLDPDMARPWSVWYFVGDPIFNGRALLSLAVTHALLIGATVSFFIRKEPEFGDARWATRQDLYKAGLFEKEGLLLGKYKGKYLVSDSPTHVMVIAPTRSGKGVGLVVPNLLNWKDSLICLDIKQENFKKTAGFRKSYGHDVFMWSPLDSNGRSHRYNPLDAVSKDPHQRISDLQVIARILIQDPVKSDPVWASEARALFIGLALYVMDSPDMPTTIGAINRLLGTEQDLGDVCRHIVKNHTELSPTLNKTLMNFANKAAKERSGVKSSLNQAINLWDNPVIDAATSASDFSIANLRKKRTAIYVGVLTGQISTLAPLLRIFFEQVMTTLSLKEPDESEPHKILLMMDEFHMLGEMPSMTSAFTLLGGYNCRVMAVVQGLKWLDDVYGRDKRDGILSCCAHQIFFAANDLETASYVSQSCGEKTVKTVSTSQKKSFKYEPPSTNTSYRARLLISKEKVKQLPNHEEIIITESSFPVRARKIEYFSDKGFMQRLLPPPEVPVLKIVSTAIPTFDIQKPKKPDDPSSQGSLFPATPPQTPPRLGEWLNDDDSDDKDAEEDNGGRA
ncbi:MAG: type IV secretory system conjugative DNA transfer family protein [Pseudomonadota bacterium]